MLILAYGPFHVIRNDFSNENYNSNLLVTVTTSFKPMVEGTRANGEIIITLRCSYNIVIDSSKEELYGHVSEYGLIVKQDNRKNNLYMISKHVNIYLTKIEELYKASKPILFMDIINIPRNNVQITNEILNQLNQI